MPTAKEGRKKEKNLMQSILLFRLKHSVQAIPYDKLTSCGYAMLLQTLIFSELPRLMYYPYDLPSLVKDAKRFLKKT